MWNINPQNYDPFGKIVEYRTMNTGHEHKNSLLPGREVKWDGWNDPKPEGSPSTHCRASKSQGLKLIDKIK